MGGVGDELTLSLQSIVEAVQQFVQSRNQGANFIGKSGGGQGFEGIRATTLQGVGQVGQGPQAATDSDPDQPAQHSYNFV